MGFNAVETGKINEGESIVSDEFKISATVLVVMSALSIIAGGVITRGSYQKNSIEYGCAQYNPSTGDFEWIKEKVK